MREGVFTLKIFVGNNHTLLTWPIVNRSEKAIQIKITAGEIWISLYKLHHCEHLNTAFNPSSNSADIHKQIAASQIDYFIRLIEQQTQSDSDALVKVRPAGTGATTKSHKFKVQVQRRSKGVAYDVQPPKLVERTFTLPISRIQTEHGEHYAPVWLFKNRLSDDETLVGAAWRGMSAFKAEVEEAAERAIQLRHEQHQVETARVEAARREREQAEQSQLQEKERLLTKIEAEGEAALAFCKQKFTLAEVGLDRQNSWPSAPLVTDNLFRLRLLERVIDFAKPQSQFDIWKSRHAGKDFAAMLNPKSKSKPRLPDQELHNAHVEWAEWHGSKLTRSDYTADGCRVRMFGKKCEITLPDGHVFHKIHGPNLKIIPASSCEIASK